MISERPSVWLVMAGGAIAGSVVQLDAAKYGSPDRVARLGRLELQRRVDVERFSEFVPALLFASRGAVNEREIFMRFYLLAFVESEVQGALQRLGGVVVLAVVVVLDSRRE